MTVDEIEERLTSLGVPLSRLLADAQVERSTWARWRKGSTPSFDCWSAVTTAFAALVAEAEAAQAQPQGEAGGSNVVALAASSAPTGLPPSFIPIATAPAVDAPGAGPSTVDGAAVAESVAALARREWAAVGLSVRTEERLSAAPGARAEIADRAANRLAFRLNRRLRAAARVLARQPATTPAALAAKARAVLAIKGAAQSDPSWVALRGSTLRDAARLDRAAAAASADVAALAAEWVRSCAAGWRDDAALERVLKSPEAEAGIERLRAGTAGHVAVLRRIADLRSTSPHVLALKAAAVLADCRDMAELDADIARSDGTSRGDGEVAVALSLVRDVVAMLGAPVWGLVAAVATAAAEPPIAGEAAAPGRGRTAA